MYRPLRAFAVAILCAATAAAAAGTRPIMVEVFDAIAYLLPLSMKGPQDPAFDDKELIAAKIAQLERASEALVAHADSRDAEFRLLARSFERSVADIRAAFAERYPAFAWYALTNLTQHCAACHGRLPDETDNPLGQRLMARIDASDLDRLELAELYVATRQPELAAKTLEQALLDPQVDPVDADLAGTFTTYLQVSLGMLRDPQRVRRFIAACRERADVPFYLRRRLGIWREAVDAVAPALAVAPSLGAARRLLADGAALTDAPGGAERAVHDVAAASMLRRFVDEAPQASAAERAEAYWLLGLIALRSDALRPAVPEMELLFEAAIRAEPGGPYAARAYALLEEYGFVNDARLAGEDGGPFIDLAELRRLATTGR